MGEASRPQMHPSLKASYDATKVDYIQLGKSGLKVSLPILGAMSIGSKQWAPWVTENEEEVDALLKGAYDCGVNTWDTANIYSNGESEAMIGRVIKKHNIPRNKVVILTKCNGIVGEDLGIPIFLYDKEKRAAKDYVNQYGLSRAAIFNAVNASLERLQTDYIDLLQIHRFDPTVPVEETMKALHDLVSWGKVRYIGASSMWTYQFAKMQDCAEKHGWTKFVSMQNHYSLCYREEEREMNAYCKETGVGLIPWGPLFGGHLARPLDVDTTRGVASKRVMGDLTPADVEIVKRVQALADEKGWKMGQVALAWVVQKGTIPIVGCSNIGRLHEACGVKGKTLTDEEIKRLEEPYQPRAIKGHF